MTYQFYSIIFLQKEIEKIDRNICEIYNEINKTLKGLLIMADLIGLFLMSAVFISFFLSPVIALICGIVRASKYNDAKLKQIMKPDSYTDEDIKNFKKSVIASFITALVLAIIVVSVLILFADDLVYM